MVLLPSISSLPTQHKAGAVICLNVAISIGIYKISSTLRKPWQRGLLAACVTALNATCPLLFHSVEEVTTKVVFLTLYMWLGSFKVLGWSINRGPLSWDLTLSQFICTYNLPITPVNSKPKNSKSNWRSSTKGNSKHGEKGDPPLVALVGLFGKILLLFFATILLTQLKVPLLIIEFFYMFVVYAFFGGLMQLVSVVIPLVCGISVAPHFCKPYFSSSFTDFWSRRWNLNTGYALRFLIYDPICEGRLVHSKTPEYQHLSTTTRFVAMCSAFIVSGIMHELFIVYLRARVSGYWLIFFSIQGPCILAEYLLKTKARTLGIQLPKGVQIVLTLSLLLLLGHVFFFPDIFAMDPGIQYPQQLCTSFSQIYVSIVPNFVLQYLNVDRFLSA